jgi:hypothetical protein
LSKEQRGVGRLVTLSLAPGGFHDSGREYELSSQDVSSGRVTMPTAVTSCGFVSESIKVSRHKAGVCPMRNRDSSLVLMQIVIARRTNELLPIAAALPRINKNEKRRIVDETIGLTLDDRIVQQQQQQQLWASVVINTLLFLGRR